jgi:hypothetical protein
MMETEFGIEPEDNGTTPVDIAGARSRMRICRVCMDHHDPDIHAATLSVHARFRAEVTRYLNSEDLPNIA